MICEGYGGAISCSSSTPQSAKRKSSFLPKSERKRRELEKSAESCAQGQRQSTIQDYFNVLNEHDLILKENEELHHFVKSLIDRVSQLKQNDSKNDIIISTMPTLLQALIKTHQNNYGRQKQGFRYKDELIRNFSMYSKDLGGKQVFDFWSTNLPLPSPSAVAHYSKNSSQPVIEGEFRWKELSEYLDNLNLEREVNICEDGTRIKGKPELDSSTNQIIGFVPPLDENGLPKLNSFDATFPENIERMFCEEISSNYAYVIMAQPLANVSPFCLSIFGTNNKFTSVNVEKRWEWMVKEAKKYGITIKGFSSDADSRLLSAMRQWTFTNAPNVLPEFQNFFFASMDLGFSEHNDPASLKPLCFQDTIHTVAKLKSQLMKKRTDDNFMPMGEYVVSGNFLHCLVSEKNKFHHGLTESDLEFDKMNFRAVQKISDDRVLDMLDSIPGANGTKAYLTVMRGVMDSFLDKNLDSYERVYLMWRSVFFLRFWHLWLRQNNYKTSKNFITSYTYHCVEVSAHSLVNVIRRLRIQGKPQLFLPWLLSSQPCECFFRDARSCTCSFSTIVNMSMKEFLQRTRKLERLGSVSHKMTDDLLLPRHHKKMEESIVRTETLQEQGLCSDEELLQAILRARLDAFSMAEDVGMKWDEVPDVLAKDLNLIPISKKLQQCQPANEDSECDDSFDVESEENLNIDIEETENTPIEEQQEEEEVPADVADDLARLEELNQDRNEDAEIPRSNLVRYEVDGKCKLMKRSTVVWMLTRKKFRLSSDRTVRVREAEDSLQVNIETPPSEVLVSDNLKLGDWCIFKNSPIANHFFVGKIIEFSYLSGKGLSRVYSLKSAPVSTPHGADARGLGCMGVWYTVPYEGDGFLNRHIESTTYHDIARYKCTLPAPSFTDNMPFYSQEIIAAVKKLMKWRPKKVVSSSTPCSQYRKTRSSTYRS